MRATRVLLLSLAGFLLTENLLFRTHLYASLLSPDSTAGNFELILRNEQQRVVRDRKQVLEIGNSRAQGFLPRYANQLKPALGYTFATVAVGGTIPRCWYYMLRDVDPTARRYAAIVIPVDEYKDQPDTLEDLRDRQTDLHYLIARPQVLWGR